MFKAVIDLKASTPTVILGLSFANVRELKKDNPILFNLTDLQLQDQWVSISYKRSDGNAAFPKDFKGIGLACSDKVITAMHHGQTVSIDAGDCKFLVFVGESEQSMEKMFRDGGLIGPDTQELA